MLTDQDVLYAFGIRLQVARESVGLSAFHDLECVDPEGLSPLGEMQE